MIFVIIAGLIKKNLNEIFLKETFLHEFFLIEIF